MVVLGARIAAARKRAGLRQIDLAAALGERYDHTVVSAIEHGRSSIRLDGLVRASLALDVSVDYLLGLTDDPTPTAELAAKATGYVDHDDRLCLAIEVVEEALEEACLEMRPNQRAELIFRVYKYLEANENVEGSRVLEWITAVA